MRVALFITATTLNPHKTESLTACTSALELDTSRALLPGVTTTTLLARGAEFKIPVFNADTVSVLDFLSAETFCRRTFLFL